MSRLGDDLARALDPCALAEAVGATPDPWQRDVFRSDARRTLLCCGRQTGKSFVASILATHKAVYTPDSLVLVLSPSLRQSQELFRKVLRVYKALGRPVDATAENALSLELESGSRIVSLPGMEQHIRSFAAVDLLVIDESARVPDDLYHAVTPFLAVGNGRLIAASTPAGLRGWWSDAWHDGGALWERVLVKTADCPRVSADFLASERASMGDFFYRQEYECDFLSADTAAFDAAWLESLINPELEPWNL
jgi:hypothetical protein